MSGVMMQLVVMILAVAQLVAFAAVIYCAVYLRDIVRTLKRLDARLVSEESADTR